jgi:hypothetical protein
MMDIFGSCAPFRLRRRSWIFAEFGPGMPTTLSQCRAALGLPPGCTKLRMAARIGVCFSQTMSLQAFGTRLRSGTNSKACCLGIR